MRWILKRYHITLLLSLLSLSIQPALADLNTKELQARFSDSARCAAKLHEPLTYVLSGFSSEDELAVASVAEMSNDNKMFRPYASYKMLADDEIKDKIYYIYLDRDTFRYYAIRDQEAYVIQIPKDKLQQLFEKRADLSADEPWNIEMNLNLDYSPAEILVDAEREMSDAPEDYLDVPYKQHALLWMVYPENFPHFDFVEGVLDKSLVEYEEDVFTVQSTRVGTIFDLSPQLSIDEVTLNFIYDVLKANMQAVSQVFAYVNQEDKKEIAEEISDALAYCAKLPGIDDFTRQTYLTVSRAR